MEEKMKKIIQQYNKGGFTQSELEWELLNLYAVSRRSQLLKAISDLKDFAYEVCPLHREDDLEEIVGRL
jgi:hypothetical protein